MNVIKMADLELKGKRVLIREDLNVPVKNGKVASDARIVASLPTIKLALEKGAAVMVMSHLGRPEEGVFSEENSMKPVAEYLEKALGRKVPLLKEYLGGVDVKPGEVVLFENVRFNKGEKKNKDELAQQYAALCDVFVMDAFGTAHRAEATTHGIARFAKVACAGPLMAAELDALGRALSDPKRPLVAIVAGAKVSTKLTILESLAAKVDALVVGGGIANTFILAAGGKIGASLAEPNLAGAAKAILDRWPGKVPVPVDAVVAKSFSADAPATLKALEDLEEDDRILDIGPTSVAVLKTILAKAGTIVWNGPVGVFEFDAFANGTREVARAIASSPAFSIAGGGDTIAAIHRFGVAERIGYISTAGGAFLEFLEGRTLPAVAALEERGDAST